MSHSDKVVEIPEGFEVIADSPSTNYAAIEDKKRHLRCTIPSRSTSH